MALVKNIDDEYDECLVIVAADVAASSFSCSKCHKTITIYPSIHTDSAQKDMADAITSVG